MARWTADSFFNGKLQIYQEQEGYRFSLDAAIVASGVRPKPGDTVLDLGTGCGIIALMLAFRYTSAQIVAIEIQDELVELARANICRNNFEKQITIVPGDARTLHLNDLGGPVDWVVCNPPYRKAHSGRVNPQTQKALARHEINITLKDTIRATRKFLRNGGQSVVIYPVDRTVDLLTAMRQEGVEPKSIQSIHSHQRDKAKLICVKGKKGGRPGLSMQPPLVVYCDDGNYTAEVERLLQP